MLNFKIEDMLQLQKSLEKLGKVPQKYVTAAARKGMSVVRKEARANAPTDTGSLKKGIILVGEKTSAKGKKVYRIVFDRAMNSIFQKRGKNGKTSYYPVSQEYGYSINGAYGNFAKDGKFVPGKMFIHGALKDNSRKVEKIMIQTFQKKIDDAIAKGGLK